MLTNTCRNEQKTPFIALDVSDNPVSHKNDNLLYSGQNASKYIHPLLKRNRYPSSILVVLSIRANFHYLKLEYLHTYITYD